jgi:hypothetical protein
MKIGSPPEEHPESSILQDLHTSGAKGPYVRAPFRSPKTFAPFAFFQKSHGFIPNFFRARTLLPHLLEAEAKAVATILLPEDVLTRVRRSAFSWPSRQQT